jgi:hypothetical protein
MGKQLIYTLQERLDLKSDASLPGCDVNQPVGL